MKIGVPTEIKNNEYRVGMVPASVKAYTLAGHEVLVQRGAGEGSAIPDSAYVEAGARIIDTAEEVWRSAEMIVKVKEPLPSEYGLMQHRQIIYTFFHLAAVPELAKELIAREVAAVAYETIQLPGGQLPLLEPMSEVAGRMSIQVGAQCLQREAGGKGVLLGGVPGVRRSKVTILGGGTVGTNAVKMAVGLGAKVTVLDVNLHRLRYLDDIFGSKIQTIHSNPLTIEEHAIPADLVIGGVLIPGAKAPHLVTREHLKEMGDGSVVVDVSVDQGGCIETCRPTTHENPTYVVEGVVHYCVANMPGAVPRTSTFALNNTTLRYGLTIANSGLGPAMAADPCLAFGLNTYGGKVTHTAVAASLDYDYVPPAELF